MPVHNLARILFVLKCLILTVFAQNTLFQYPRFGNSVSDATQDPGLRIYLNSSNANPDKYNTLRARGPHLIRSTYTGQLQIFDIFDSSLKYYLFRNVSSQFQQMTAYDISENHPKNLAVIFNNNTGRVYTLLENGTIDIGVNIPFNIGRITMATGVSFYPQVTFVLGYNGVWTNFQMLFRNQSTNFVNRFFIETDINTLAFNIKSCTIDNIYYVAIWKRNCLTKIYSCRLATGCYEIHSSDSTDCSDSEYYSSTRDYYNLEFSLDCRYVLYQQKNVGVKVFDILSQTIQTSFTPISLYNTNNPIDMWFVDVQNRYVGTYYNSYYQLHQLGTTMVKKETRILLSGGLSAWSLLGGAFYLSYKNEQLNKYYDFSCNNLSYSVTWKGLCEPDPTSSTQTASPTSPTVSPTSPTLADTTTSSTISNPTNNTTTTNISTPVNNTTTTNTTVSNTTNNSTSPTNSSTNTNSTNNNTSPTDPSTNTNSTNNNTSPTNSSTSTNSTNSTNTTTQNSNSSQIKNQTNSTTPSREQIIIESPSQKVQIQMVGGVFESYKPISKYEEAIGTSVSDSFTIINVPITFTLSFVKFIPFTFLFLRFINFWSICTMYLIPKIIFPSYLTDILSQIYTNINKSLFEAINFHPSIDTQNQEKFTDEEDEFFGFSSDLLNANLQSFLILIFSWLVLFLFYIMSKMLPKGNFIRNYLTKIDYKMATIAQYVSIMNAFYFNLPIVTGKSYQNSFSQKINILSQNFFIFFSTFTACFSFILLDKETKDKSEKQQTQKEKLDWFIDCMCNSLLPFITIIRNVPLFLGVNFVFFMLPVYSAFKEDKFRAFKILQSSYLPLFNFGVIAMMIFDKKSFPNVYHNSALLITVLIFLGAIHELLVLFGGLVYDLIVLIRFKCKKVSNEFQENSKKEAEVLPSRATFTISNTKRQSLRVKPAEMKEQPKRQSLRVKPAEMKEQPKRQSLRAKPAEMNEQPKRQSLRAKPAEMKEQPKRQSLRAKPAEMNEQQQNPLLIKFAKKSRFRNSTGTGEKGEKQIDPKQDQNFENQEQSKVKVKMKRILKWRQSRNSNQLKVAIPKVVQSQQ